MAKKKVAKATTKGKARTPPYENWPAWSQAKWWGYLRSILRSGYNKYPPKWAVLNEAKRAYTGNLKQQKWEYLCNGCGKYHKAKDVSVDHIIPAGSLTSYEDLVPFVQNLFCSADNLQVLCKSCHSAKTLEERAAKSNKENK